MWPASSPDVVEQDTYSVVHYPAPSGELTSHPNIYQPWDLQHLHFPEFFSPEQLRGREVWRICSERATYVLVASRFVRDDVIAAYDVEPERVAVVPPGVPTALHAAPPTTGPADVPFALYPAQSWKHKNHLRMLEAIAVLKGRGTEVTVVCPGPRNPHEQEVRRRTHDLGLDSLVRFPGYLTDGELAKLYQQARLLLFPSLFEGFGFPVLEAFTAGLPVTCSSTTSLPELAADAALLFDPTDVEAMAEAIERVWTDDGLRAQLVERGHTRAASHSWDHLARSCRALYRAAARQTLNATDVTLLAAAGVSP
jgi:glycosyltransferase involved in cell wall biosynthesis